MKLTQKDKQKIVMIGNNLKKDIAGANRFGITFARYGVTVFTFNAGNPISN